MLFPLPLELTYLVSKDLDFTLLIDIENGLCVHSYIKIMR
jgi:hypothetical protein